MSYHRFIGGTHDGEWHDVQRDAGLFLPRVWTLRNHFAINFNPNDSVLIEPSVIRHTDYVPLSLNIDKNEVVTFYIERSIKPKDALLRLAECYRPAPQDGRIE